MESRSYYCKFDPGNTIIEMAFVLTFIGIVLFTAYMAFRQSAEDSMTADSEIIGDAQILDQVN